jgi:hypothetical protein
VKAQYPIYVPSKGRADVCLTAQFLVADEAAFHLVVEPQEYDLYASRFGAERVLVLPWRGDDERRQAFCAERGIENGGLIAVRNWIKEHAIAGGHARHWQLDDNIECVKRRHQGLRIVCNANFALAACEEFVDRYENVAIAGLNYVMFAGRGMAGGKPIPPFQVNCHVYSCSLILNSIPHRWRARYNDDTDICLQVLADGWCTVLFNAFLIKKKKTMTVKGGNTQDLYQGDGRLRMARSLERQWPGVVKTDRRFKRPQHVVKDAWKRFDTPLRLKPGIDLAALPKVNEYGMTLKQVKPIKSEALRRLVEQEQDRGAMG